MAYRRDVRRYADKMRQKHMLNVVCRGFWLRWNGAKAIRTTILNTAAYTGSKVLVSGSIGRSNACFTVLSRQRRKELKLADEHFNNSKLYFAFSYWRRYKFRCSQLHRSYRIFRKLHPILACSVVAETFRAWRWQFLPRTQKVRQAALAITARHRQRKLFTCFDIWLDTSQEGLSRRAAMRAAMQALRQYHTRHRQQRTDLLCKVLQRTLTPSKLNELYQLQQHYREYAMGCLTPRTQPLSPDATKFASTDQDTPVGIPSTLCKPLRYSLVYRQELRATWSNAVETFIQDFMHSDMPSACCDNRIDRSHFNECISLANNSTASSAEEDAMFLRTTLSLSHSPLYMQTFRTQLTVRSVLLAVNWLMSWKAFSRLAQCLHLFQYWKGPFLINAKKLRMQRYQQRQLVVTQLVRNAKAYRARPVWLLRQTFQSWKSGITQRLMHLRTVHIQNMRRMCFKVWWELFRKAYVCRHLPAVTSPSVESLQGNKAVPAMLTRGEVAGSIKGTRKLGPPQRSQALHSNEKENFSKNAMRHANRSRSASENSISRSDRATGQTSKQQLSTLSARLQQSLRSAQQQEAKDSQRTALGGYSSAYGVQPAKQKFGARGVRWEPAVL